MNGPRRRLLVATGSLLAGLAGCLGANSDGRTHSRVVTVTMREAEIHEQ